MIEIDARRCLVNNSGQVVYESISDIETIKINPAQIINIVDFSEQNYPNTNLVLCTGFIGFITDNSIVI